jgi:phosphoribosylaminoimidazole-succinocarboxamide synthase
MGNALYQTDCPGLTLLKRGKVRDLYDLGENLLIVATDRLSAFDVVMDDPIPDKGIILTQLSFFWFEALKDVVDNHIITGDVEKYPEVCQAHADQLRGRSMLVRKVQPLPIECVVRGYISGSGWKSYQQNGAVCGIRLPDGLRESDKLPEPLFTPSTKAEVGEHDENIDFEQTTAMIGRPLAEAVRSHSLAIYKRGASLAAAKGIIIADTKFEFGRIDDRLLLIDEVLTPDSSRFWPQSTYQPGGAQSSFDKQYFRDYLLSLGWQQQPPPPKLPEDVIQATRERYLEALELLTGSRHGL